jgi:hypothetical protein
MKTLKFILLSSLLVTTTSYARIGETYEQCVARYGNEVKEDGDSIRENKKLNRIEFLKSGVTVYVYLSDRRVCEKIEYINITNEDQMTYLLLSNSGGTEWELGAGQYPAVRTNKNRQTNQYKRLESLWFFGTLIIQTTDRKIMDAVKERREEERLKELEKTKLSGM